MQHNIEYTMCNSYSRVAGAHVVTQHSGSHYDLVFKIINIVTLLNGHGIQINDHLSGFTTS